MPRRWTYILLAFLLFSLVSCNSKSSDAPTELPGISVPIQEMNTAFVIEDLPVLANSHENGDFLALSVRNISDQTVIFSKGYGLSIFVLQEEVWKPVQNRFIYADSESVLPVFDSFPPGLDVVAYPYIPFLQHAIPIRIVMIGHVEDSVEQEVGAYIDIDLLP